MTNSRVKSRTGNPNVRFAARRFLRVGVLIAQLALEQMSTPAVIGRSNRYGSAEGELVVLGERARHDRERRALAAAEEVRCLERELSEEAFELRDAGAEGQLVPVLLLELQRDVDLVLLAGDLLDLRVVGPSSMFLK